jgi:hypothetical protein
VQTQKPEGDTIRKVQRHKAKQDAEGKGGEAARRAAKPPKNKQHGELRRKAKPKATRRVAERARQEDQEQQGELHRIQKRRKLGRRAADPQGKKQQRARKEKALGKDIKKAAGSIKGEEGQGGEEGSLRRQRGKLQGNGSARKVLGSSLATQAEAIDKKNKRKRTSHREDGSTSKIKKTVSLQSSRTSQGEDPRISNSQGKNPKIFVFRKEAKKAQVASHGDVEDKANKKQEQCGHKECAKDG